MSKLDRLPADVVASLRRHVTAALDDRDLYQHGTLYERALQAYAISRVTADCPPSREFLGIHTEPADWEARRQWGEEMEARVAALPRGAWLLVGRGEGRPMFSMMGAGGSRSGHTDFFETVPDWQRVYDRMVGYEVYTMRCAIETERQIAADHAAIAAHGWTNGQTFKGLRLPSRGRMVTFTTCAIVAIEGNGIRLTMTLRGSARSYGVRLSGQQLARAIAEAAPQPPATRPAPSGQLDLLGSAA